MATSHITTSFNPLDHSGASLANHAEPVPEAESSRAAQGRSLSLFAGSEDDGWVKHSPGDPAKINPYHLLVHPNTDEALPPLPPHLEALTKDPHISSFAENGQTPEHTATRSVSRHAKGFDDDGSFEPPLVRNRMSLGGADKGGSNLKSTRNGTSPVSLQEPPPSPPVSEIAIETGNEGGSSADPETNGIMFEMETPFILTQNITSEPIEADSVLLRSDSSHSLSKRSTGQDQSTTAASGSKALPAIITDSQPRLSRRMTNPVPSSPPAGLRSPLLHSQSTFGSAPRRQTSVPGVDGAVLDSDILAQAENIRRERLERRQKKENIETEDEQPGRQDSAKVLVGNLIGEDHVNYVLMYNMLTGIRIGVSRCQAKVRRPLTDEDYMARHKYSFDIVGNELTPSAKYDFKFKDYAPWVFRDLREEHFHLDPADYLLSLTAKYILSELGSPGKSGSFFYFSRDYRFIIKTISHSEHKFLRSILKDYHEHVKSNPHTLLSRFYGLHRVKLPRGRKIHFVIMNNLFPPHRDIHETYDLKGSAYGREYPEEKARQNPKAVLKDINWVNRGRVLELGPEKRALLSEQLRRDMQFLRQVKVMDYSLLVGIHNMARGNRDNLRENQLSVFHPDLHMRRKPSTAKPASDASNVRKAVRRSDPKMLDVASQLPNADSADRRHFLFYQDEGGLRATDEANQNLDMIYYLGIIDICTPYNNAKKLEHLWKSMTEDRHTISCVDSASYGQRFLNFLLSVMRGGDLSLRPAGLERQDHLKAE